MFVWNRWYVFGLASEVAVAPLARTIMNHPIVAFRDGKGKVAILEDRCPHRALPLSLGHLVGGGLRCLYHGLEFDREGRCTRVPGQDEVKPPLKARNYPSVEKDQLIWIWMGDAEADPALIPDYPYHNDTAHWGTGFGSLKIRCNYELVHDNLLDLTHLAFVHPNTIGGASGAHFNAEMDVKVVEDSVKVTRWMMASTPPPTYAKSVELSERVDRWQEIIFTPGLVLNYSGAIDAGKGAREGRRVGGYQARNLNALTPETETTTHYFYSASHGHNIDRPGWTQQHVEQIRKTFLEDIDVLERQQESIDRDPERVLAAVFADRASLQARRIVARLKSPVPA